MAPLSTTTPPSSRARPASPPRDGPAKPPSYPQDRPKRAHPPLQPRGTAQGLPSPRPATRGGVSAFRGISVASHTRSTAGRARLHSLCTSDRGQRLADTPRCQDGEVHSRHAPSRPTTSLACSATRHEHGRPTATLTLCALRGAEARRTSRPFLSTRRSLRSARSVCREWEEERSRRCHRVCKDTHRA